MKLNTLQLKLPILIVLGFALATGLVQYLVSQQMTRAINQSLEVEYSQKLQTILQTIQSNDERLQRTGMVATYRDDFQDSTLRQLRQTYFQSTDQGLTPLIINAEGKFLLAQELPELFGRALQQKIVTGERNFTLPGTDLGDSWCVFRTFEPWGWSVGYVVPYAVKYRVVNQLKKSLWLVFAGVTLTVVILLIWVVRVQLKPIATLTEISAEMAQGNLERRIQITRKDEVGILADHFNRMQNEIKQTIESLRRSEKKLSTTLNSIGDAVISTDVEMRITRMNPNAEKLTGWSSEEAIAQPLAAVLRLVNEKTREPVEDPAKAVLDTGKIVTLSNDTLLLAKNGSEHPIADSAAPIRNEEGLILGVVLVFRDVAAERDMQEQLLQSRKMDTIGQLAGGVAHDFNNMLGGIIGSAELLKRRLPEDQKSNKYLGMIMESAERAADLVSKLLAFARKQHISSTPVDAHFAIRNSLALLESTIDRRIRINSNLAARTSMVVGDLTQLQNVFLNLCINASHAMPDGGNLTISTQVVELDKVSCEISNFDLSPGSYLEIEVRDTGCGIPADQLERIFEPFFTTKEQGQGTGLGLAAVLGTIQSHKGAVTVYSEVGSGTVFHVLLPLTDAESVAVALTSEPVLGSGLVLVVDDEAVMRATAAAILEDLGYQVLLAENGVTALELFRERSKEIDLVLLDMIMPEMNGRDCFTELQKLAPNVKVVLSSGFARSDDLNDLKVAGLCGFIRKPYRGISLSRVVAAALVGMKGDGDVLWGG